MKLKKIASLMLAGVMAVSMLAGCSGNGNGGASSENQNDEPTGVNAAAVIAALDEDTTKNVTFSASSDLQKTLEDAIKVANGAVEEVEMSDLQKIDADLSTTKLSTVADDTNYDDKELTEQSFTFIKTVGATNRDAGNYTDKYTVNELADQIDDATVTIDSKAWKDLPLESDEYTSKDDNSKFTVSFNYAADVAVATGTSLNGDSIAYVVVTVTRPPGRVGAN